MSNIHLADRIIKSKSSRLSNRNGQVIALENGRIVEGKVERIYTTRGVVKGRFYDFSRKSARRVTLINNECWRLQG